MNGKEVQIHRLTVNAGLARITALGRLGLSDAHLDLKVEGAALLDEWESFLKLPQALRGRLDVHCEITGALSAPEVAGEIVGADLSAFGYEDLVFTARSKWSSGTGILNVDTYAIHSGAGSIDGSAHLVTTGLQLNTLRANFARWDIRPVTVELRSPLQLASLATGSLTAEWATADFAGAAAQADFRLEAQPAEIKKDLVPLAASLRLVHAADRTQLRIANASAPGLNLHGDLTLAESGAFAGEVDLDVSDIGTVSEYVRGRFGESSWPVPFPLGGSMKVAARVGGSLSQPNFQISLRGAEASRRTVR